MLPLISVTPHLAGGPAAGAGHTDTQFLEAQCVATDPAGVDTTGVQSMACVYDYAIG